MTATADGDLALYCVDGRHPECGDRWSRNALDSDSICLDCGGPLAPTGLTNDGAIVDLDEAVETLLAVVTDKTADTATARQLLSAALERIAPTDTGPTE